MSRATTKPAFAAIRSPEFGLVVGIVAVLAMIFVLDPSRGFFALDNVQTLVHNVALYGVMALGAAIVIIAGGIDLSVGSVAALASVVSAKLMTEWLPGASGGADVPVGVIAAAVALTLLMGLLIGLLHAFLINRVGLPPFIATLATMAGLRSLAAVLSHDETVSLPSRSFRALGYDPWITVAIFTILVVAIWLMMSATVLGRHLYALGGNEAAARLSGLPTRRLKGVAYGLAGMLSALGGLLFTAKLGLGDSTLGNAYELFAITAAVVGGCSLSGGIGSIRGTVLGLILLQIVIKGTGLVVKGIDSSQIEGLVLGTVVVLAVGFNQRFRARG